MYSFAFGCKVLPSGSSFKLTEELATKLLAKTIKIGEKLFSTQLFSLLWTCLLDVVNVMLD